MLHHCGHLGLHLRLGLGLGLGKPNKRLTAASDYKIPRSVNSQRYIIIVVLYFVLSIMLISSFMNLPKVYHSNGQHYTLNSRV